MTENRRPYVEGRTSMAAYQRPCTLFDARRGPYIEGRTANDVRPKPYTEGRIPKAVREPYVVGRTSRVTLMVVYQGLYVESCTSMAVYCIEGRTSTAEHRRPYIKGRRSKAVRLEGYTSKVPSRRLHIEGRIYVEGRTSIAVYRRPYIKCRTSKAVPNVCWHMSFDVRQRLHVEGNTSTAVR